jgi:hypothetical protein
MAGAEQTLIAINRVRADRADDFEEFLRSVVVPATKGQRPDLDGRWRVLRATGAEDGVVVFAFVCEGGVPTDWELRPILEASLGSEGADRAMRRFGELLTQEQEGWFLTAMPLDGS